MLFTLLSFFFITLTLFFLFRLETIRKKILPKKYYEEEERLSEKLKENLEKNSKKIQLVPLVLGIWMMISFMFSGNLMVWYSFWVVFFGFFYIMVSKVNSSEFLKKMYLFLLKSTFIPSFIAYRLSIINLALLITELLSKDLGMILGEKGKLLATIPTLFGLAVTVETLEHAIKAVKESVFLSKFLNEIPVVKDSPEVPKKVYAIRQHIAMHAAKQQIKGSSNYIFKTHPEGTFVSLHKNSHLAAIRQFTKTPDFIGLTKNLAIARENTGQLNLVTILNELTDAPYKTKNSGSSLEPYRKELNDRFSDYCLKIKEVPLEQRRDLINFVMPYVIMENLPKEALLANQEIETIEILNDPADPLYDKKKGNPRKCTTQRLVIQVTEASALKFAESYFRSLGEILTIERSAFADYKIIYKEGKEVHIECKYSTEEKANEIYGENGILNKLEKENKLILQKGHFFRAWLDTETKEFTTTQHFGVEKEAQKEVFKIENVEKNR